MDAGTLTERVSIIRDVLSYDHGAETRHPEAVATVWAAIRFLGGRELVRGQQLGSTANVEVTIRYRSDVRTSDRLTWGDWTMEIRDVIPDVAARESLTLRCEAKRA